LVGSQEVFGQSQHVPLNLSDFVVDCSWAV
jgi:hypothetical protein